MAHPHHHAISSQKKFGGEVNDTLAIHQFFDASKEMHGDFRHRALRHHAQGIFECERVFGVTLTLSSGRVIPTRWVAEQHVVEDLGFIPALSDWLSAIKPARWMTRSQNILKELEGPEEVETPNAGERRHDDQRA